MTVAPETAPPTRGASTTARCAAERAAETRERIITAGAELLHGFPVWNWRALTVRGVAERAGVNERTVYRYFASERELRDAVLARLEQRRRRRARRPRARGHPRTTPRGSSSTCRRSRSSRAHPTTRRCSPRTGASATRCVAAVSPSRDATGPTRDRAIAAAMLDVLWSVASYERLVVDWDLDPQDAITGATWVIGLVEDAIQRRPAGRTSRTEHR